MKQATPPTSTRTSRASVSNTAKGETKILDIQKRTAKMQTMGRLIKTPFTPAQVSLIGVNYQH